MKVLVTGASGYIGGQVCKQLFKGGHTIVGLDRRQIKHDYFHKKYTMDYGDTPAIEDLLWSESINAVVHIAATSLVGPSMTDPHTYYSNNVSGTLSLMNACVKAGVTKIVFASSAACYGEPSGELCTIADGNTPINPYGWTKRMTEVQLSDFANAYGLDSVSLRFFNVAGADSDCEMGQEKQATHIIARVMESALAEDTFTLYGDDYPTPDGTCIRDYIHVEDVASGLTAGLKFLEDNKGAYVFNLGGGSGYSNMDIVNAVARNTPLDVKLTVGPRREGDPAKLVADVSDTKLDWKPKHSLDTIIKTAYNWYIKNK